ncbi:MAG: SH3 domain-containing protein [Anaerolineales bacterium]
MFRTPILICLTLLILLVAACAPLASPPTPSLPTPAPTDAPPIQGLAIVQSVDVQILENSPLQANAIIRGQLPDAGCTTITAVDQVRDGNTLRLTLTTSTDPLALCAQAFTPFEKVVALDVTKMPPARYMVNANGIERSFELITRSIVTFNQQLVDALNARNYDLLRVMMDDAFLIATWRSEGTTYQVEPAIQQLQANYLNTSSTLTANPAKNLTELLGGVEPVLILGPDLGLVNSLFVSGLGADGKDEAILFVAYLSDGSLYWHGLLFAKGGFVQGIPVTGPQPVDTNTYPTTVGFVMAQQNVSIYSGPGNSFAVLGNLYGGQIASVTGTNVNGSWWRVICPNNTTGSCWVSADSAFTRPTTLSPNNPSQPEVVPTIAILSVIEDENITIRANNFPADTKFDVLMGKMGTKGIDGIRVDTIDSKKGGTFTATFEIPRKLHGEDKIAIRLESKNGYYSYNWFDNITYDTSPRPRDAQPTNVKFIVALDTIVVRDGPGGQHDALGTVHRGEILKVLGISQDGKWWSVRCPQGIVDSCWISANPHNTKPSEGPFPGSVESTNVKYVKALQDVSIHNGPGKDYFIIGLVASGQTARVTGINSKGNWWRVMCPNDTIGNCWVSANPNSTDPTDLSANADVQSVEIQILESDPIQVNVIARGQLPDTGCTTIANVSQNRSGNTFKVKLTTKVDPLALCAPTLTSFEYVISLDVSSLLPAHYIVNVNGVEASFELPESVPPAA